MRITSIELAGRTEAGQKLPRALARIRRTSDAEYVEVAILRAGGERKHMVRPDSPEDLRSMAACLQHELDGYDGGNSEITEYLRVLESFAD